MVPDHHLLRDPGDRDCLWGGMMVISPFAKPHISFDHGLYRLRWKDWYGPGVVSACFIRELRTAYLRAIEFRVP